jgi:hypothetical protein
VDVRLHDLAIIGMDELQEGLEAVVCAFLHPEDATHLRGPDDRVAPDVPFPAADHGDPLRVGEPRLAAADGLLGGDPGADVARERGGADDRPRIVTDRSLVTRCVCTWLMTSPARTLPRKPGWLRGSGGTSMTIEAPRASAAV